MKYTVDEQFAGKTVKELLFTGLSLSRAQVVRLKARECGIMKNGKRVTVREVLGVGDVLTLELEDDETPQDLLPYDYPLEILYEDEDLVCVNKPRSMPTHPSHGHFNDTLANALAAYYLKQGRPFVFRAVNRLDRDTTGVVLIAKNKRASALLSAQISARTVGKEYVALLDGTILQDEGAIDKNILRTEQSVILRRTDEKLGERAFTTYKVIERKANMTLVMATPHTGRTHQLRVHFASIGHPIFGDSLYGDGSPLIDGQALHAQKLSFMHPQSGRKMTVVAPLPSEFSHILKEFGFETV